MMMIWFTNVLIFALITKNVKAVEMTSLENLPNVPLNDVIIENEMTKLNELRQSTAKVYRDFIAKLTSNAGNDMAETLEDFALEKLNLAPQIKTENDYCENLRGLHSLSTVSDAYKRETYLTPEENIIFKQEFVPATLKLFEKMLALHDEVKHHDLCATDFFKPKSLRPISFGAG